MNQILCCDWLHKQARWSDAACLGLPILFQNKILLKSKRVHEGFLLQNIFHDSKKIFCDFSVGMELENENPESINMNENKETKIVDEFQEFCNKKQQTQKLTHKTT